MSTLGGKKKMLNVHVCAECRLALVKMVMVYTVNVGNMLDKVAILGLVPGSFS